MHVIPISISNGFYVSDSLTISNQECVNWYVNIPQVEGALSTGTLFGGAGIEELLTTGAVKQANRGAHVKAGKPYFLNGETLVRIDNSFDANGNEIFTAVELGTIPGEDRVSMAENGIQLMFLIPVGTGYIIDESAGTPLFEITDIECTANGNPQMLGLIA